LTDRESCAAIVRRSDPDRYFSALFAPQAARPHLFALCAFNHELAHAAESAREPMIRAIRLQWWREALDGARSARPRNHGAVQAMAEVFAAAELPSHLFDAMIDARAEDPVQLADDAARDAHLDATSGNLMRLASRILGSVRDDLAHQAGIAYGLVGLLRNRAVSGDAAMKEAARRRYDAAHLLPKPGGALAAFLPAALVPLYLRRIDPPLYRKQLALLRSTLRGRV